MKKTAFILCVLFAAPFCFADAPALPAGLGAIETSPALPAGLGALEETSAAVEEKSGSLGGFSGFFETRFGSRTQGAGLQDKVSIAETRLQLEYQHFFDEFTFDFAGDFLYDATTPEMSVDLGSGDGFFDLRRANVTFSPVDFMDVRLGRQTLTWGTGDLVFINDMFPKDWRSFFIGRDDEYLKAPSDALKLSFFTDAADFDVVYTPRFDSDRFISGERISYWNGLATAGEDSILQTDKREEWLDDYELAARASKTIGNYELALYGYRGYWKSPMGLDPLSGLHTFDRLNVYGASARGQLGRGIANVELGLYDSLSDTDGDDFLKPNSQMRYLAGYEFEAPEIAREFTIGMQYYIEQTLNYSAYEASAPAGAPLADQFRQLFTLRLTKLLWNQNIRASVFTYFSPTDKDAYLRPKVNCKLNDSLSVELGANIFTGDYPHTFFGQFAENTNIYAAVRYSF